MLEVTKEYIHHGKHYVELSGYPIKGMKKKIVLYEPWVGSHTKGAGKVYFIDNNLRGELDQRCVGVHEIIEKWLKDTFFPNETNNEAYPKIHPIAEHIEKKWHIKKWGLRSWQKYMHRVNQVFSDENNGHKGGKKRMGQCL